MNNDQFSSPSHRPNDVTIVTAVTRHRWLVAAFAVVAAAIGGLVASRTAGSYTSSAGMVLQDPASILLDRPAAAGDERRYIASQVAIIKSQSVAEAARQILATASDPITRSADHIRQSTSVSSSTESNFVEVSVQAPSPREAQATVDAVVAGYRAQLLASQTATVAAAIARLDDRIASALADFTNTVQSDDVSAASDKRIAELSKELTALPTSGLSAADQTARAASIDAELQAWLRVGQARREETTAAARQIEIQQSLKLLDDLRSQRNSLESHSAVIGDGVVQSSSAAKAVEDGVTPGTAVLISLFIGLVLGSGLAYWLDSRRRSVVDRRQPSQHLGTRILAEVPAFVANGEDGGLLLTTGSDRVESFQFLANDLESAGRHRSEHGWTLAFVGIRSGDGASTIAANVARWAAIQGRRVVAVDADVTDAVLSTALWSPDAPPLTTLADLLPGAAASGLKGLTPVETFPGGGSLTVVAPGRQEGDFLRVFQPDRVGVLFGRLADMYDVVVVDVPALLDVAGGSAFLAAADSVVVVVRHKTSVNDLDLARDRLDLLGVTPVGYVYNHGPATVRVKEQPQWTA